MDGEFLTIGVLLALVGFFVVLIFRSNLSYTIKWLIVAGLVLRIIGGQAYYLVAETVYGFGDYTMYYGHGLRFAESLFSSESFQTHHRAWGTLFTIQVSGVILALLGPTVHGAFLVFSLFGYVGILALALAFHRAFPAIPLERYLVWIVFFPSLWYWPAALGKDAIILAGVGLAVLGFASRRMLSSWPLLLGGVGLIFLIRPQVAVVLFFACIAGHWLSIDRSRSFSSFMRGVVLVLMGVFVAALAGGTMGVHFFDYSDVTGYLTGRAEASSLGGSAVETGPGGISPAIGFINVMFRPFIWEVNGLTMLIAALEVMALWGLAWYRRREIASFFKTYRRHRVALMALVFMLVYAAALGMAGGNLGTLSRIRIHIFPFLFMFFAGLPVHRMAWDRARAMGFSRRMGAAVAR